MQQRTVALPAPAAPGLAAGLAGGALIEAYLAAAALRGAGGAGVAHLPAAARE
jgi:hypothetical protein